jgi:hypothetical protein
MECRLYIHYENDCATPATTVIFWGCLQQHIREFPVCPKHYHMWITWHNNGQIRCANCMENSAEYMISGIDLLKEGVTFDRLSL